MRLAGSRALSFGAASAKTGLCSVRLLLPEQPLLRRCGREREPVRYGVKRRLCGCAVGAARLRHVGPSAAALAAERRRASLDEVNRAILCCQIVRDANNEPGLS